MVISSHIVKTNKAQATNPTPHYHQIGSQHAKESDKRKLRRKRMKKTGTTTSQDVGSGEDFTIYKDEGSTEEEDNKESSKTKVEIGDSVRTGSSDFFVSSPNNDHKGSIIGGGGTVYPQSLCGVGNMDNGNDYAQWEVCIGRDGLFLILHNCMCFVYSLRECGDTILVVHFKSVVSSWEREDNWILKITSEVASCPLLH
jgi:hypothetical protein